MMFRGFCFLFGPLLLPLVGPLGVLLWALSQGRFSKTSTRSFEEKVVLPIRELAAEPHRVPPELDDLRRIAGIGPKIADTLNSAGIRSFAQLAKMEVGELERIVKEGGIRIAYPETWPEQAVLAAAGDWDGLEVLQRTLARKRRG